MVTAWDYLLHQVLYGYFRRAYINGVAKFMFWIYLILIFISGGSGIGFIIQKKYAESIIVFVICILLIGLLYYYLKRNKKRRNLDCGDLDCTDCLNCDCND